MYAFNRRLQGKEIFGMPVVGAVGLLATLIFSVFSLLMPWGLKLFTIPLAVIGGLVAFWVLSGRRSAVSARHDSRSAD
jgi:uncharacterized membrane protein YeaQ/YmgE (transglycosylase-associated protein family)